MMKTEGNTTKSNDFANITYERIIVPSSMRSLYWKYFGFPADSYNNILTKTKIVCVLCNGIITYNKNTTNLRTHLVAKHQDILVQLNNERKDYVKLPKQCMNKTRRKNNEIIGKRIKPISLLKSTTLLDGGECSTTTDNMIAETIICDNDSSVIKNENVRTLTITHQDDIDDFNGDKTSGKVDNIRLKLSSNNVVSIIEALQDDDDVNMTEDHIDNVDLGDDGVDYGISISNNSNKFEKNNIENITTVESDFIEDNDYRTYSVTLEPNSNQQQNIHIEDITDTVPTSIAKQTTTKIIGATRTQLIKNEKSIINDNDVIEMNNTDRINIVVKMLLQDLLSIDVVDDKGFQNYSSELNRNFILPKKNEIVNNIKELYEKNFTNLINPLKEYFNENQFSLSMELWKNFEQQKFLSIYFNYYEDTLQQKQEHENLNEFIQMNLLNVLYKTVEIRPTSCFDDLEKLFDGINMKNCVGVITNEDDSFIIEFFLQFEIPVVICFEATISSCLEKVFKLDNVSKILTKVQDYIELHSDDVKDFASIKFSNSNYWSKLNALNVYCNNTSLKSEVNEFDHKVKCVLNALQPLKITLETLTDEPIALSSLVKPFTTKLLQEHFSISDEDSQLAVEIKDLIAKELKEYIRLNEFYSEAAFFDPRFQSFIDTQEIQQVRQNLCDKFKNDEIKKENTKKFINVNNNVTNKRSSLKHFFKQSENKVNVIKNNFDLELKKYVNEANADLEQCPLIWWIECGYLYRHLKKIAQKYFCVPCCINNNFRLNYHEQIQLFQKRSNLDHKYVNYLWFLYYNKELM